MEIRLMKNSELQSVILIAKGVYEKCAKHYVASPAMMQQFYDYIRVESLWQKMQSKELYIWGALDGQTLCGIGAMQNTAHITMLYVHPAYQRRGIGTSLLSNMMQFAENELGARRVTVHVIPAAAAPFFYCKGYVQMKEVNAELDMIPLEYRFIPDTGSGDGSYPVKSVKPKTIVWLIVLFYLLAVLISSGTMLYYLLTAVSSNT